MRIDTQQALRRGKGFSGILHFACWYRASAQLGNSAVAVVSRDCGDSSIIACPIKCIDDLDLIDLSNPEPAYTIDFGRSMEVPIKLATLTATVFIKEDADSI